MKRPYMETIRKTLAEDYKTALNLYGSLTPEAKWKVSPAIDRLLEIKNRIEAKARELGHSQKCKKAIPECRGECCRWHFPRSIPPVDFQVMIFGLTGTERGQLGALLSETGKGPYQCPLLLRDGCFLSFEHRPMVCTKAYPCTLDTDYWNYLQQMKKPISEVVQPLEEMLQFRSNPNPRTRPCGS